MEDFPSDEDHHSVISLDPPEQAPPDYLAFQAATQRFSDLRNRVPPTIIEEDELSAHSSMHTTKLAQSNRQPSLESDDATESARKQSLKVVNESKQTVVYVSDGEPEDPSYGQEEQPSFNREDITVTEQHHMALSDIPQHSDDNASLNFEQSQPSLMGSS